MQAQAASLQTSIPIAQRFAVAGCQNVCHAAAASTRLAAICPPECYVYLSTLDAMRKIARQEGTRVLWTGTREGLLMAVPMVGLYLPLYDNLVHRMSSLGAAAPVVAGTTARTFSMFCVTPIEVLRVRMQSVRNVGTDNGYRISNLHSFDWGQGQGLLQRARALWRGFGATVVRDVPFTAVYWGLMEPIRKRLLPDADSRTLTDLVLANTVAGFSAGIFASVVTQPMDVVKTRTQIAQKSGAPIRFLHLYSDIYKAEGIRGLFAGVGPRTLRIGPSCALVISTYELLKRIL